MSSESPDQFVPLAGGYVVPVEALRVLWALEDLGCRVEVADDGALLVAPARLLSLAQKAELRRWKRHLVALVRYQAPDDHLRCGGDRRASA